MALYTIGLTGSIGSGKSTVSRHIRNCGFKVFDADEIARGLTSKGSLVMDELCNAFGSEILDEEGELDRRHLAKVAFSSDEKKELLGKIVTEKAKEILDKELEAAEKINLKDVETFEEKIVFFDIPLLFEYEMQKKFDEIWNVDCDRETRYERARERDGISREDFFKRDEAQVSPDDKLSMSNITFHNDGTLAYLIKKVDMELARLQVLMGHRKI